MHIINIRLTIFLGICFLASHESNSQSFYNKGIVIDKQTGQGIEGAHIYVNEDSDIGTISNAQGKYFLKSSKSIDHLVISHVRYRSEVLSSEQFRENEVQISLTPSTETLKEVVLIAPNANKIIKEVIARLNLNHSVEPVYFQFFSQVVHFSEKDSIINIMGEYDGYLFQNERYNTFFDLDRIRMSYLSNLLKNQVENHRLTSMTQMHQDNIGKHMEDFLHKRRYEDYLWSFDDGVTISGRPCHVLNFISMKNNLPSHGKLYLDKEDYGIHKKISGFGGADFIEINFKKIDEKYYLSSAHRLHHGYQSDLVTWRSTRYYLVDRNNINTRSFINLNELQVKFLNDLAAFEVNHFDRDYFDKDNFIAYPRWGEKKMKANDYSLKQSTE